MISFILIIRVCFGLRKINNKIKSIVSNVTNLQNKYFDIDRESKTIKRFCVSTLKVGIEVAQSDIKNLQNAVFFSNLDVIKLNVETNKTCSAVSPKPEELVCVEKLDSIIFNLEDAISKTTINPFQ